MMTTPLKMQRHRGRTGLSFVELLTALTVLAVTSTAAVTLLSAAGNTALFATSTTNNEEQCEFALRRIAHNIRAASQMTTPTIGSTGSSLTITTQPDATLNTYNVTYTLLNGNLVENDTRYNGSGNQPNIIAAGVTSFVAVRSSTANPTTITVTLSIAHTTSVSRTIVIGCRNL